MPVAASPIDPSLLAGSALTAAPPLQANVPDPLETGELLWVFLMLTILLVTARALGELAKRFDLPAVVGELSAGILLGPSVIDSVAVVTEAVNWVEGYPVGPQLELVEVIAWIGLLMLIILTGLETDLDLIVSKATESTLVALASIVVPFAAGFAFAWLLPEQFLAADGARLEFALFMAVAMSISAIPVIAKILMDMGHVRRNFGQITLAAGMINDTIGWILLALVAGLAEAGSVELTETGQTLLWLAAFLGVGFTVGLRAVRRIFIWVDNVVGGQVAKITTLMVLALGVGSFTHALHLEAVLGAFVVGILVGQVNRFDYETEHTFEVVTIGVFAPIFFAIAGLRVNLGTLVEPLVFAVAVAALAIAVTGKFVGAYVGAKAAGLSNWEGVTMGAGLNARGAMEIIVATIGYGMNVLTIEMYSIVVMIAIVTSLMAPPMLRWALPKVEMSEEERERIAREERLRESFVANISRVLQPTRGGADSQYAARLLGPLVRDTEIELTTMYVAIEGDGGGTGTDPRGGRWFANALDRLRGTDPESNDSSGMRAAPATDDDSEFVQPADRAGAAVRSDRRTEADSDAGTGTTDEETELFDRLADEQSGVAAEAFDLIERRLGPQNRSPRTVTREVVGSVAETILDEAAEGYDLLVLGEAGRGNDPDEPLFSETVDYVIQHTPCPTMVVSTPYSGETALERTDTTLRRILLPTAGTEYNRHAAEIAFAIAAEENAIVEIVHVVNEPQVDDRFAEEPDLSKAIEIGEEIVDREAELGRQLGAEVLTTVEVSQRPEATMIDLADQDDVDLIVMGTEMRPVSKRAFYGHRVEYVIQNADCPVGIVSSI
ncbi:cation:proton antiporter domain-containing protein [Natrinema salifodinae]|uniref:Kef-type K+ transport system, membrane component KefB n=1 Tax=Natrinema salifodinae TaxID=1202768 RepID=A0A1I0PLI9_9EURY|nr:cation:proton antiporter [Natrinema salifodinae]SEW15304.1 Kef-type K+ transport system, membrane component KefB [Natrinema salifodinae]